MKCLICNNYENEDLKGFATHLQMCHGVTSKQYTIKYLFNNMRPMCLECGEETRYVSFMFKRYCKKHSKLAMSENGKIIGKMEAWNKGKTKHNDPRLMEYSIRYSGEGNPFYGKTHTEETKRKKLQNLKISKLEFKKRKEQRKEDYLILTPYDEYTRRVDYLDIECKKCGKREKKTLQALERGSKCISCHPGYSKEEQKLKDFIKEIIEDPNELEFNTRKVIPPHELDIYIPEHKLAIEYNGLYFHSEHYKDKNYHQMKTDECIKKGIHLLHIFSDEWENKEEIIKSMIRTRLGKCEEKIYARKCEIKQVSNKDSINFFEQTHIAGSIKNNKISFGLFYEDKLFSCISLRTPHSKKRYGTDTIEVSRFSSKLNSIVVGGLSKLIKHSQNWAKENRYNKILTYVDMKHGIGNSYVKSGFEQIRKTDISYWYSNGKIRENRFKYRAQNGIAEKEIAFDNQVYKVYGCKNIIYELSL